MRRMKLQEDTLVLIKRRGILERTVNKAIEHIISRTEARKLVKTYIRRDPQLQEYALIEEMARFNF